MNDKSASSIMSYIAHIPYVLAQIYLGLYFVLLIGPIAMFIAEHKTWQANAELYHRLLQNFPEFWSLIFKNINATGLILLLFLVFPIGFILSEASFRLGCWIKYHDNFDLEAEGHSIDHFKFRARLLGSMPEYRVWEWQSLQFNLCYYSEILFLLFSITLLLLIVFPFLYFLEFKLLKNTWFLISVGILGVSLFLWLLSRRARKQKLNDFRNAHKAVKSMLFPNSIYCEELKNITGDQEL